MALCRCSVLRVWPDHELKLLSCDPGDSRASQQSSLCVPGQQDPSDELQPKHAGWDHRAPDLQEKAIQGLRKHSWGCQVWVTQGIASHRAGACGQEGHWDLWAGLRRSLEGPCNGNGDFWCGTLRAVLKASECFLCLGCKMSKSESGSFRKEKSSSKCFPAIFCFLMGCGFVTQAFVPGQISNKSDLIPFFWLGWMFDAVIGVLVASRRQLLTFHKAALECDCVF